MLHTDAAHGTVMEWYTAILELLLLQYKVPVCHCMMRYNTVYGNMCDENDHLLLWLQLQQAKPLEFTLLYHWQ